MSHSFKTVFRWVMMLTVVHGNVNAKEKPVDNDILQTLKPGHPRLLADAGRFELIQSRVQSDARAKALFTGIVAQANEILTEPVVEYEIPDGRRLLKVSRQLMERIYTLALVWQINRDPKMLDRAWRELSAAAAFKDWNPSHFLDTAEMTCGMAIGYDWLYHGLSDAQRKTIREAIITHGLKPGARCYQGKGGWVRGENNWNQVCNGGMIAGALAIADEEPQLAATIVSKAVQSLPLAMRSFGPDGGWFEGPGYWAYAMDYNVLAIGCLDSALGKDFGLSQIKGFDRAADFYIQMAGATGKSFNYADGHVSNAQHPTLFWLATKFKRPDWANYQLRHGQRHAKSLLWYDPELVTGQNTAPPMLAHFRGVEVASARTRWNDKEALFVAVKSGRNGVTHAHLDLGSFVFEALGERWIIDLGADNYNLPEYFGKLRYTYYRMRAEGHNTLVINPGRSQPDQNAKAMCTISKAETQNDASVITTNLTPAYAGHGAKRVERTFSLTDKALVLSDIIELDKPGEAWWFFHTSAEVQVAADGRRATLKIGGKSLSVNLESPANAKLVIMDAGPLPGAPNPPGQNPNNGSAISNAAAGSKHTKVGDIARWGKPDPTKAIRKLAIRVTGVKSATMRVVFSPGA